MDEKVKAEWIKALRSGEFQQGAGKLVGVTDHGALSFCCLGVLCEISPVVERFYVNDSNRLILRYKDVEDPDITEGAILTEGVMTWAGIESLGGGIRIEGPNGEEWGLTSMNDEDPRLTFDQIADVIEYFL
jgi:hypothetical protein